MPKVPIYNEQQVQERALPGPQQQGISQSAPNMLAGLGKGVSELADEMNKQQEYADSLRAEEAFNQLRERQLDFTLGQEQGYIQAKGKNALPQGGQSLTEGYMMRYQNASLTLEDTLSNDRQKQLFRRYADRAGLEFKQGVMRHEDHEIDSWRKQTVDGVFAVESNNAAKNWNNPEAINLSRQRIELNLGKMRDADGVPADQMEKIRLGVMSKLHAGVLDQALEQKHLDYAQKYLKEFSNEIDANTLLKAQGHITKEMNSQYAFSKVDGIVGQAFDPNANNDVNRAKRIAGVSGGGDASAPKNVRMNNPGNLKDTAGNFRTFNNVQEGWDAMGKQLLIYQNRDKLTTLNQMISKWAPSSDNNNPKAYAASVAKAVGVSPDASIDLKDPALLSKVMSAMANVEGKNKFAPSGTPEARAQSHAVSDFDKLIKINGGNIAMAFAANKIGQEYVDRAADTVKREGMPEATWIAALPNVLAKAETDGEIPKGKAAETMQYVASSVQQYQAGGGKLAKPTFEQLDSQLRGDAYLRAHPEAYAHARTQLKQQFDERDQAVKQRQKEAEGEAYRLMASGVKFRDLPVALRNGMDPMKLDEAAKFENKMRVTDTALYQKLTMNPGELKNMTDGQFYALTPHLDDGDFKHFAKERAKLQGKQVSGSTNDLNTSALNTVLNQRLSSMKIDPTPKDATSDAVRVGAIRQFITRSVLDAQSRSGKKFEDADIIRHVDGLFANSVELKGFFGGKSNVAMLTMKPGDVPSEWANHIKAQAKAGGYPEPTDADVLQMYWTSRTKQSALKSAKAPKPSLVDQIPK